MHVVNSSTLLVIQNYSTIKATSFVDSEEGVLRLYFARSPFHVRIETFRNDGRDVHSSVEMNNPKDKEFDESSKAQCKMLLDVE